MTQKAIQDYYADEIAICYGCGRHNSDGLHVKTYWDGETGICHFTPRNTHTAFPGVVYGGLIASIIDCHTMGTAIGAMYSAEGREPGTEPAILCVTGNLNVSFVKPTPTGTELELRASIKELTERKAIVTCEVYAGDMMTVTAEVVAVSVGNQAS